MNKTKLMTPEAISEELFQYIKTWTKGGSVIQELVGDDGMRKGCLMRLYNYQANAILVAKEACCAAMCEGCAERLPVNSQAEHYYTDDDGSPCDGQPCYAYRAGCLTPDLIRKQQEKDNADQG